MFELHNLEKMMSSAKIVKELSMEEEAPRSPSSGNKGSVSRPNNKSKPNNRCTGQRSQPNGSGTKTFPPHNRVNPPFRRLTPAEIAERRAKELCFKCDERFYANHVFLKPDLMVVIMFDDGTEEEFTEEPTEVGENDAEVRVEVAELSINSAVGLSSPRTMKLRGTIQGVEMIVLIDSRASHNLISERLAAQLGLRGQETMRYRVLVAGGVTVAGKGMIQGVELQIQGCIIQTSFLPLELGIADVIWGVQWLDTLGKMWVN